MWFVCWLSWRLIKIWVEREIECEGRGIWFLMVMVICIYYWFVFLFDDGFIVILIFWYCCLCCLYLFVFYVGLVVGFFENFFCFGECFWSCVLFFFVFECGWSELVMILSVSLCMDMFFVFLVGFLDFCFFFGESVWSCGVFFCGLECGGSELEMILGVCLCMDVFFVFWFFSFGIGVSCLIKIVGRFY